MLFRALSLNMRLLIKPTVRKITRNRASNDDIYDIVDIGQRLLPEVCLNWGEISKKFAGRLALEIFVKILLDYWRLTLTTGNNVKTRSLLALAFCYSYKRKRCVYSLSVVANHERTPVIFFGNCQGGTLFLDPKMNQSRRCSAARKFLQYRRVLSLKLSKLCNANTTFLLSR